MDVDRPRATARPRALRELLLGGFYATPLALSAPDPLSYLRENNPANEAQESADDVARTFAARAGVLRRGRRAGAFQRNGASEADDGREHEPPSFYQDADRYPPHDRSKASRLGFGRERYGCGSRSIERQREPREHRPVGVERYPVDAADANRGDLRPDWVRVAVQERPDRRIEITEVLVGPLSLGLRGRAELGRGGRA